MFKTIITEATFFSIWLFFHEPSRWIHRTTGEEGDYPFNSLWGTNYFGQTVYGEVILNGRTNDRITQKWGRSFINDVCIFQ